MMQLESLILITENSRVHFKFKSLLQKFCSWINFLNHFKVGFLTFRENRAFQEFIKGFIARFIIHGEKSEEEKRHGRVHKGKGRLHFD